MECAHCRAALRADDAVCPACGRPAPAARATIVEGTILPDVNPAPPPGEFASPPPGAAEETIPPARALVPAQPAHPALAALAHLPACAWRRPAVRSAVKTGAGAVALTVALRLAGRWVTSRGARQAAGESLLPALADLLAQGEDGRAIARRAIARRGRHGEITETFIYLRRTVRL